MKTGVPLGAIKLKMDMDGVDSSVDLRTISKSGAGGIIPVPPAPPMGGIPVSAVGAGMAGVFADIKKGGGGKLKKTKLPTKQREKTGLSGKISLSDILKARGKLNKTGSKW